MTSAVASVALELSVAAGVLDVANAAVVASVET